MSINIKKWNPWNWFKHEGDYKSSDLSVPSGRQALVGDPLMSMHREVDRLFDTMLSQLERGRPRIFSGLGEHESGGPLLKPNLDIKETQRSYQIYVEVPGVEESDIKLELVDGALTISGEKRSEKKQEDENFSWAERSYGSFSRTLALPSDIQEDGIEAKYKSGVLTITVPRKLIAKHKEEPKVITVKSAA